MINKEGPLWQLEQNAKNYRNSSIAFHEDSIRLLKKSEEASKIADEYDLAIEKLKR